ncbi:DMT family transporter [Insolitispirillum peregrinum]|uniref:DMT family transporter n=1 Tax=Insolitispirillum peregrinum TaxID=80876 RepID=UPI0036182A89
MSALFTPLSCLLVVGAGISVAFQQILNANLRTHLGSPWWAGVASYLVGMVVMLAVALLSPGPRLSSAMFTGSSWITWSGGLFGAIFIGVAILMVPSLGAAAVLSLMVVGQMLGSLAFDHFGILGLPHQPVTLTRLAGAACLILGVVLVRKT